MRIQRKIGRSAPVSLPNLSLPRDSALAAPRRETGSRQNL